MREEEIEWVQEAFTSGRAAILRLVTDHSIHDCGKAAGIPGGAWWRFENGESITAYRAETLYTVLRRLQNGERLGEDAGADAAGAPIVAEDEAIKRARHEVALLIAAENLLNLSPTELVKTAPRWDSPIVRETRSVTRRVLRRRILDLGGEPLAEDQQ
jgi:hypothetical protein